MSWWGVCKPRTGVAPPPPSQDRGTLHAQNQDGCAARAVCLLRLRRRTFYVVTYDWAVHFTGYVRTTMFARTVVWNVSNDCPWTITSGTVGGVLNRHLRDLRSRFGTTTRVGTLYLPSTARLVTWYSGQTYHRTNGRTTVGCLWFGRQLL